MKLCGKVAVVTGASSGMGKSIALLYAKEGASVVAVARRKEKLNELIEESKDYEGKIIAMQGDVSRKEDNEKMIDLAIENFGKIDILVNNAGVLEEGLKPIDCVLDDDMDYIIDTNTKGTMYCMREAANEMMKTGNGSIVNVSSVAGAVGNGGAAYVSSKAAIIGVTKHTSLRFAGTNIRCNVVCPGTIVTPMVAHMNPEKLDRNMMGQMAKHSDLSVKPCMPDDVANIVLFLASDESRAITGQTIISDFGSTL